MKRTAKKVLSIILVISMLTAGYGAFAQENSPQIVQSAMGDSISCIGAGLTIGNLGYATCTSSLEFTYSSDTGTTYMYLQRLENGCWTNVDSWTNSGSIFISQTAHAYVASGYYRVHVVGFVYSSGGTLKDSATQDSNTVYYN